MVVNEGKIPRDWDLSTLIPIYKGKSDSSGNKVARTWDEGIGEGFGEKVERESNY